MRNYISQFVAAMQSARLRTAVRKGDIARIVELLSNNDRAVDVMRLCNPLQYINDSRSDILDALMRCGLDPAARPHCEHLVGSLLTGQFCIAKRILANGADANMCVHGITPLCAAAYRQSPEMIHLLAACGASGQSISHIQWHRVSRDTLIALQECGYGDCFPQRIKEILKSGGVW